MPTPSEQKALAFLAFVILLGGAVRVVRAGSVIAPTADEQRALARQAAAAESAGTRGRSKKSRKGALSRSRRLAAPDTVAGVAGVPFQDVRPDRSGRGGDPYVPRDGWVNGFPPPLPRVDTDNRQPAVKPGSPGPAPSPAGAGAPRALVDVDVADVAELEGLPRVGRATALRIVASRDSLGPFGALEALARVKGMGPATRRALATRVTFSRRAASSGTRQRDR